MRSLIVTLLVVTSFFICSSTGCRQDDSVNVSPATPMSGDWIVSYFNDRGVDKTYQLAAYHFDFRSGGVLVVSSGSSTINGTWQSGNDDSHQEFIIGYTNAPSQLAETAEDWNVVTNSESELDLTHSGSGHLMEIHFTKQ